ncbi:hypothetical protein PG987_015731 [Apiospora arundinis]
MSDQTPSYTSHYDPERETLKRKNGRLVGAREQREKIARGRGEWIRTEEVGQDGSFEKPNALAGEDRRVHSNGLTLHRDSAWNHACNWEARRREQDQKEKISEEIEQGFQQFQNESGRRDMTPSPPQKGDKASTNSPPQKGDEAIGQSPSEKGDVASSRV